MRTKLLSLVVILHTLNSFSQKVKGTVLYNSYVIPNVEVINSHTKQLTVTDAKGEFTIDAKTNDILIFVSKQYQLKKLVLNPLLYINGVLEVDLILKAEELSEVVVTNIPSIKLGTDQKWEQTKLDQYTLEKTTAAPQVQGVYTGAIVNGLDFMRIGGMLLDLFLKDKGPAEKEVPEIAFKDFAQSKCDSAYLKKTLHLQPEEIGLFLEFCDADPKSKTIAANQNVLSLMDFLFEKNTAFKNLATAN